MFWFDIYGLSDRKDKKTIEMFLGEFAYRAEIEDRAGDIITIFNNEKYGVRQEEVPIDTTSQLIDFGIENKNKGFCAYFHKGLKPNITSLLIKFTYDDKIIYGVSVDKNDTALAIRIRDILIRDFSVKDVSIEIENPPADDEKAFYDNKEQWRETLTR